MIFSRTACSVAPTPALARQPVSSSQNQQRASNTHPQPVCGNWQQWDSNDRITCGEARAAGIAPVPWGHPAYPLFEIPFEEITDGYVLYLPSGTSTAVAGMKESENNKVHDAVVPATDKPTLLSFVVDNTENDTIIYYR